MLYVKQSLGANEELIHIGEFHWMYTVKAIMNIFWGIVGCVVVIIAAIYYETHYGSGLYSRTLLGMIKELHPGVRIGAFLMFIMGLLSFAQMMVVKASTEIAITTSRLVYKRGLIARHVGEMSIDRIEGVNVLQSILGRIFDYGRLAIRGMGVGEVVLPPLNNPIAFRRAIEKARNS